VNAYGNKYFHSKGDDKEHEMQEEIFAYFPYIALEIIEPTLT
jgi:hypothetical protein